MFSRAVRRLVAAQCDRIEARTLLAAVTVTGTSSADVIRMSVSENGSTIIVEVNDLPQSYPNFFYDGVSIEGGNGRDTIYIDSTGDNNVTVNGGGGDDTVQLGEGAHDLDPITQPVSITSSSGADQLWLFDENSGFASNFTFNGGSISRDFFGGVTFPTQSIVRVNGTAFGDTFTVNGTASSGRLELFGENGDDLFKILSTSGATVVVDGNSANFGGSDRLEVNANGGLPATVTFENTQIFSTIQASAGGDIVADRNIGIVLTTNLSNFNGNVTLANGYILETNSRAAGGLGYWRSRILNGIAGTGEQLKSTDVGGTSRYGIGYAYGTEVPLATIDSLPIGDDDLFVRVTLKGDANLDGTVNFNDLLALAQNYGQTSGRLWSHGNSDHDNDTDFGDLLSLAQNYGQTAGALSAATTAAPTAARRRMASVVG